jgi:hypothetical protein
LLSCRLTLASPLVCPFYFNKATAGHEITLEGWEAFDAAVHCAAISAGQRMKMQNEEPKQPAAAAPKPERKLSGGGMLRKLFSRTNSQQGA